MDNSIEKQIIVVRNTPVLLDSDVAGTKKCIFVNRVVKI